MHVGMLLLRATKVLNLTMGRAVPLRTYQKPSWLQMGEFDLRRAVTEHSHTVSHRPSRRSQACTQVPQAHWLFCSNLGSPASRCHRAFACAVPSI